MKLRARLAATVALCADDAPKQYQAVPTDDMLSADHKTTDGTRTISPAR